MKFDKRGQGATEYLLMLAAVLVIVAVAVYYITSIGPSSIITGTATIASGDNTTVVFTPSSTMVPSSIPAADWRWAIYRGGTAVKTMSDGVGTLERGLPVNLPNVTGGAKSGDLVKIQYHGNVVDAATIP
jgi:hypothetical protein